MKAEQKAKEKAEKEQNAAQKQKNQTSVKIVAKQEEEISPNVMNPQNVIFL